MNTPSITIPESPNQSQGIAIAPTRPMYWSLRRELWENWSIYIVPLIVALVVLLGFLASTIGLAERRRAVLLLDPAKARAGIEAPYDVAAIMLIFTAFIVGVFYCLDALHGERRDRSILFWKSLPVSDLTTVFSKATIQLVVLPVITFNTSHFAGLLKHRLLGFGEEAFAFAPKGNMPIVMELTPGKFLRTPGLWIGLVFAAAFIVAAIRLRRYRGPL